MYNFELIHPASIEVKKPYSIKWIVIIIIIIVILKKIYKLL